MITKKLAGAAAAMAAAVFLLSGCPENPYAADTWIEKLNDPNEAEAAITQLQQLCDPKAIEPLGKAWERDARPARHLQVMIELSRPLTPEQADKMNCTDFAKKGREAGWDKAMPFLVKALELTDLNNLREIDNAVAAAAAISESAHPDGEKALIKAITGYNMDATAKAQKMRASAILALKAYKTKDSINTLANVIRIDDTAKQPQEIIKAAIITLGAMRVPDALPILLEAMYRVPRYFQHTRKALIAVGGDVTAQMRKILEHKHDGINTLFAEKKYDQYCGEDDPERESGEKAAAAECKKVSAMDFSSAYVLGDLYDAGSVDLLHEALKREMLPGFYQVWNPGPPAQTSVLEALRKIGDPRSAQPVLDIAVDSKLNDKDGGPGLRAQAIRVYGMISADGQEKAAGMTGMQYLIKMAAGDVKGDEKNTELRLAAAESIGRLGNSADAIAKLKIEAGLNKKKSDDTKKLLEKEPKKKLDAATKTFDAAKAKFDEAQKGANKVLAEAEAKRQDEIKKAKDAGDKELLEKLQRDTTAANFVSFVDGGEKTLENANKIKEEYDKIVAEIYTPAKEEYDSMEAQVRGYKNYQRQFENRIGQIELAMRCSSKSGADKMKCLMEPFDDAKGAKAFANVSKLIDDDKAWTEGQKEDLRVSQIERAVIELRRMGAEARPHLDRLLDEAKSTDRLIRESILLALPRIAALPCEACVTKLDTAIKEGAGKAEFAELNYQTELVRDYMSWAGKK